MGYITTLMLWVPFKTLQSCKCTLTFRIIPVTSMHFLCSALLLKKKKGIRYHKVIPFHTAFPFVNAKPDTE